MSYYSPEDFYPPRDDRRDARRRPPRRRALALSLACLAATGGFVLKHADPIVSHIFNNGGAPVLCASPLGVNFVCSKVDQTKAVSRFGEIVKHISGGDKTRDVYLQYFEPAAGSSRADDKAWFAEQFDPVDYMTILGAVHKVNNLNTYQAYVEVITDVDPADTPTHTSATHKVKHDEYLLTMHFTLKDPQDADSIVSTVPQYERQQVDWRHTLTASRFEFSQAGHYYKSADQLNKSGRLNTHEGTGGLAAYCMWIPAGDEDKAGNIIDWDKVAYRTYAGWVRNADTQFDDPKAKLAVCQAPK